MTKTSSKRGLTVALALACGILVLATTATDAAKSPPRRARSPFEAVGQDRELSLIGQAVTAAGLQETLSNRQLAATLFLPTNKAVRAALRVLGITLQEFVSDKASLTQLLTYHVVGGAAIRSTDLQAFQFADTLLAGTQITVTRSGNTVNVTGRSSQNVARVVAANIVAGRSIIHKIDAVLLPPFATVAEAATLSPDLSTLLAAVKAADLVGTVANPNLVATLFLPVNPAFVKLINSMGTTAEALLKQKNLLQRVLPFHVIPSVAVFAEQAQSTQTVDTLLPGARLTINKNRQGQVTVIGGTPSNVARVIVPNIRAGKAVIHLIDTVLIPA